VPLSPGRAVVVHNLLGQHLLPIVAGHPLLQPAQGGDVLHNVQPTDRVVVGVAQRHRRTAQHAFDAALGAVGELDRLDAGGRLQELLPSPGRVPQRGKRHAQVLPDQRDTGGPHQILGRLVERRHQPVPIGRDQGAAQVPRHRLVQERKPVVRRRLLVQPLLRRVQAAHQRAPQQRDHEERGVRRRETDREIQVGRRRRHGIGRTRHQTAVEGPDQRRVADRRQRRRDDRAGRGQEHRRPDHRQAVQESEGAVGPTGDEHHPRRQPDVDEDLRVRKRGQPSQVGQEHRRHDRHGVGDDDREQQQLHRDRVLLRTALQVDEGQGAQQHGHQHDAQEQVPVQPRPQSFRRAVGAAGHRSAYDGPELEDRQVHGNDQPADDDPEEQDDQRLHQRRQVRHRVVDLFFVKVGNL